ncbi:MAG: glucose-6-phosphate dehydrogenase [Limnochordaceae bacterium]|nr:glucose-6-phosphate dehydrogenase [Limnochordaceae bacterium]
MLSVPYRQRDEAGPGSLDSRPPVGGTPVAQPASGAIVVIFGATGDLARRKLFPALYGLYRDHLLPAQLAVVGIGRREKDDEVFRAEVRESVRKHSRYPWQEDDGWHHFQQRFHYFRLEMHDREGYRLLASYLDELDATLGLHRQRVYYLAVMPELFGPIAENLQAAGLVYRQAASQAGSDQPIIETSLVQPPWQRVVIEKPFGYDLVSATRLNQELTSVFKEQEIFRIDHYLGKEMSQNLSVIRFANAFFEPVWNHLYVDNVQITSSETVGAEERGEYYDEAGALRDMVQNHMLQLVAMTAMEPPGSVDPEAIRDEKVKVFRALRRWQTPAEVQRNTVRGQYTAGQIGGRPVVGYRQEPEVRADSNTETFAALRLYIDNFRWAGVPFYIRTGKRLPVKATDIVIQFKPLPQSAYLRQLGVLEPNRLVIHIQPMEGMYIEINAKRPGTLTQIDPVAMEFCQNCGVGVNSPEAYERLLYDVLRGDPTLFTRWDEVEQAWEFVDPISKAWKEAGPVPLYPAGSWGPPEACQLLEASGCCWWPVQGEEAASNRAATPGMAGRAQGVINCTCSRYSTFPCPSRQG